ncbi:hypothetical protein D3C79_967690 [compost metagenome]
MGEVGLDGLLMHVGHGWAGETVTGQAVGCLNPNTILLSRLDHFKRGESAGGIAFQLLQIRLEIIGH